MKYPTVHHIRRSVVNLSHVGQGRRGQKAVVRSMILARHILKKERLIEPLQSRLEEGCACIEAVLSQYESVRSQTKLSRLLVLIFRSGVESTTSTCRSTEGFKEDITQKTDGYCAIDYPKPVG